MKDVPIKFRGKAVFDDKFVYGDLIYYVDGAFGICPIGEKEFAEVYPKSVAQLVGYDIDGAEVYEDDTLVDENGVEYRLDFFVMFHNGTLHLNLSPANVKTLNLKLQKGKDND